MPTGLIVIFWGGGGGGGGKHPRKEAKDYSSHWKLSHGNSFRWPQHQGLSLRDGEGEFLTSPELLLDPAALPLESKGSDCLINNHTGLEFATGGPSTSCFGILVCFALKLLGFELANAGSRRSHSCSMP